MTPCAMPFIPPFMGTRGLILEMYGHSFDSAHPALLSTIRPFYSEVGVGTDFFFSSPGARPSSYCCRHICCSSPKLLGSMLLFLQLPRRILSVAMRFRVGGDAEHYTLGINADFLLLLVHMLPYTMLLWSMLALFLSAHIRTATARYRAFATNHGDTTLYSS